MEKWLDEQMDCQIDGLIDIWIDEKKNRWIDEQIVRFKAGNLEMYIEDCQIDVRMGKGRQITRQIDMLPYLTGCIQILKCMNMISSWNFGIVGQKYVRKIYSKP